MASPATTLPPLDPTTALWRIEKMRLAEIKTRLAAFGLPAAGTKRTLAKRLRDHIKTLPPPETSSDDSTEPSSDESTSSHDSGSNPESQPDAGDAHRRGRPRRTRSRSPLTSADIRAVKSLLRRRSRHDRHRSPSATSCSSRSDSPHSHSTSASGSGSSRGASPSSEDARHTRSRRHHVHRPRGHTDRRRRSTRRDKPRSRRHRRPRRHESRHESRQSPDLPPIPDRLRGRIRRGEFIDLSALLQANLTAAYGHRGGRAERVSDTKQQREAPITDFTSWVEAWSLYSAVLTSYYPHLAQRLFQYQHFLALKSKTFRTAAWLRYDTEFRLKLAANGSWQYHTIDTELWASCFAADGLVGAAPQQPGPYSSPNCFTCGSTGHFYAQCPQRRLVAPRTIIAATTDAPKPPPLVAKDQPSASATGQREICLIFNDKGRCFRGSRCPYTHTCAHCGGQHPKRSCPHPSS